MYKSKSLKSAIYKSKILTFPINKHTSYMFKLEFIFFTDIDLGVSSPVGFLVCDEILRINRVKSDA
jgi:hypothetical protein